MRRLALLLAGVLLLPFGTASAEQNLSLDFARCAGRLAALSDHHWMFAHPQQPRSAHWAEEMDALLATVTPPGREAYMINAKVDAMKAHKALLYRSQFNGDRSDALWARKRAEAQLAACTSYLLDGEPVSLEPN